MNLQGNKDSKIKKMVLELPKGTVISNKKLIKMGISRQLVNWYIKNRWVETLGSSAYKFVNDQIDLFGGLYTLQSQLYQKIHAGGKTSLELQGYAHYLSEQMSHYYFFAEPGQQLPAWFKKYDWGLSIIYKPVQLFTKDIDVGFTDYSHKEFSVRIASPERAVMEMLYLVPGIHGFDESYRIMENLTTLRPDVVQQLLENCCSIKTKRLFMYMAEKAEHAWLEKVNIKDVNFGCGKRVIVGNGKLDKKYNITVPRDL